MTRRSVLATASAAAAAITPSLGGSKTGSVDGFTDEPAFDPTRHGFGFYNWRTQNGPYPETDDPIEDDWRGPFERAFDRPISELPDGLLDALAHHAREGLLEAFRTNGYCYGMVFAAQRYFEEPETIPAGFETASEITRPNAPRSSDETPVLDEIVEYHTRQYLDFDAWLGRYGLIDPTLIDYDAQLSDLFAMIDAVGTAGITVFREDTVRSHQVLVYDYERHPGRTVLFAYDPNYAAETYERFTYTIEIDTSGARPVPQPIEHGVAYDQFVHNDRDREILADSERSGPLTGDGGDLHDRLFGTTLFVTTDPSVETTVLDPAGRPLARTNGIDPLHYRYGAETGSYALSVTARGEPAEYAIDVYAGSRHREFLEETIGGSIDAGETERYELALERDDATLDAGLPGIAALGAAGGYAYRRRS